MATKSHQEPQIKEAIQHYYDLVAVGFNEEITVEDAGEILSALKPLPAGASILDAGSGSGAMCSWLDGLGYNMTGVDFSRNMILFAKSNFPEITFLQEDLPALSLPDKSFDGVVLSHTLTHIVPGDVGKVLHQLYRVLKPGGLLYLSCYEGAGSRFIPGHPPTSAGDNPSSRDDSKAIPLYIALYSNSVLGPALSRIGFTDISFEVKEGDHGEKSLLPEKKLITICKRPA